MLQLRSWLAMSGTRAHDHLSTQWAEVRAIVEQAQALERQIRKEHGIIIRVCDDAERFKELVDREDERLKYRTPEERPILAPHADPVARNLTPANFFGLIGQQIGKRSPLYSTNTLSIYPRSTLRDLFTTQKLFCDFPDTDAPYEWIEIDGYAPELDQSDTWCHGGTMWINPEKRGKGLAPLNAELVVRVGWLRWGFRVFGTVHPGKGHVEKFRAPRVLGTATCKPTNVPAFPSTITLYGKEDFLKPIEESAAC